MTATVHTFPSRPLARGRLAFAETLKATDDPVAASMAMLHAAVAPHEDTPAMKAALARINADFGEHAIHDRIKRHVRTMIRLGTGHEAVRYRYRLRVAALRDYSIDQAIRIVETWHVLERDEFWRACKFGRPRGRLSLEVLKELRLLLRFLRRSSERDHLQGYIDFVLGANEIVAAE